jgi:ABC-2 type transport system ATP-binding protein
MNRPKEIAVAVKNLSKHFRLPTERSASIKQSFINWAHGVKGYKEQKVLRDISFQVEKGDFFGIVGRNGSGKSTLLKLISGIYQTDGGSITVNGSLVSFIELGVGFNGELTGRENVYLNGSLMGFSVKEIDAMYDEIVDFAELHDFMDQKLKNYSSGMQVRLAFSCAIQAKSDILVLDEVLAVGDEAFQQKCQDYFFKAKTDKKTVILVTHSMDNVRQFCNKAILIQDGKVAGIGNSDKIASMYSQMFIDQQIEESEKHQTNDNQTNQNPKPQLSDLSLKNIKVLQSGQKAKAIQFGQDFSIEVYINSQQTHHNVVMGVHLINQAGLDVMALSTKSLNYKYNLHSGLNIIKFDVQNIFTDGEYYFNIAIADDTSAKRLLLENEVAPFSIVGLKLSSLSQHGLTYPNVKMEIVK